MYILSLYPCDQSERATFGRQYSDDEDEERCMYDRSSELMGTELARDRPSKTGALGRFFRSAPKVSSLLSTSMYGVQCASLSMQQLMWGIPVREWCCPDV